MDKLDGWRLCDDLTVVQAALLLTNRDPSHYDEIINDYQPKERPEGYDASLAALSGAILSGKLPASIKNLKETTMNTIAEEYEEVETDEPDWHTTTILVDDIRDWLKTKGTSTGFFFNTTTSDPDYLNPNHPRYAPKLAAAVNAWLAVDDAPQKGISAKQALTKWLKEHASEYNMTNNEGTPIEQGITECAKVANWQTKGGAPKTP